MGGLQSGLTETGGVRNLLAAQGPAKVGGNIEEGVKSAAGNRTNHSRHGTQAPADELPSRVEFLPHFLHTALITLEGGQRGMLTNAGRATRLLALNIAHRPNDSWRTHRPTHAPTGHRISLAATADRDGPLRQSGPERCETCRLGLTEHQLLVDF